MKIINYSAILLATLFLAACQKDEQPAEFGSDANAVHIDATVGGSLFTRSNPMAPDAATQKKFNTGDRISIVADGQAAVVYAFDGTNWAPETSDQYLKWETNAMDFSAFYPVTTGTSLTAFTLPTDQSSEALIANADYMSLTQQLSKPAGGNTAELILERQMARVIVEIAGFGDQYTTEQHSVSNVRITSAANAIGGSTPTVITPYAINGTGGTGSQGSSYTALIIPATTQDAQDFITLTDGAGKTLSVKGIPAIEAGKSYTYTLTVGKDALIVGSVTVSAWTDGTAIPGGEAKPNGTYAIDNNTGALADKITNPTDVLKLHIKGSVSDADFQYIRENLTSLEVLDLSETTLTSLPIRAMAFYTNMGLQKNTLLKKVVLPTTLITIGNSAFAMCAGLQEIIIPSGATMLGRWMFEGCEQLTDITIPEGVESLPASAFYGASGLQKITIPSTVKTIGDYAFKQCSKLTSVTIPSTVTTIGISTFEACSNLVSANIESGAAISSNMFYNCSKLEDVKLSQSITEIKNNAFAETNFKEFVIPNHITQVGEGAFSYCTNLESATIHSGMTMSYSLFAYCSSLKKVTIPEGVTEIGAETFRDCTSLQSVTLPSTVSTIRDRAFQGCTSLTSFVSNATTAPNLAAHNTGENYNFHFYNINASCVLKKPASADYSAWNSFFKGGIQDL